MISFPNHLYYPNTIPKKIKSRFSNGGLGGATSYHIVSCQNWKGLISWRYDFGILWTQYLELAKDLKGRYYAVPCNNTGKGYTDNKELEGCSMGNLVREIRKEVNFNQKSINRYKNLMEQGGYEQFSLF